jgi:hypothetical protein
MAMPVSRVDSRALRITLAATVVLVVGWLVLRDGSDVLVGTAERIEVRKATAARMDVIAAERCPRPALREPATGDGAPLLVGLADSQSAEERCLAAASKLRWEVQDCKAYHPCKPRALAAMPPLPELVALCEPLYAVIEKDAHTTEACSPWSRVTDPFKDPDIHMLALPFAIEAQVAPVFARGDLATAARHIIDAMRFADDDARKGYLVQQMMSPSVIGWLGDSLVDILTDPRLTADEARHIAHDLDVLLASGPTVDAVMRRESCFSVRLSEMSAAGASDKTYSGDADQDAVLHLIAIERSLERVERACRDKPLRACLEWSRAEPEPTAVDGLREQVRFAKALGIRGDALREHVVHTLVDQYGFHATYTASFGARRFVLTALRVQAELRTMTADECRDPQLRRTRLARWLDDIVLSGDAEPIVDRPAWQTPPPWSRRSKPQPPRTLACIDRK